MPESPWRECPAGVQRQVDHIVSALRRHLNQHLVGVYLHGSLAMGCFNPRRSDVDLLVVTEATIPVRQKQALVSFLLKISGQPSPVEVSFLTRSDLSPWRFPTPYDLHFSEDWRARFENEFDDKEWRRYHEEAKFDPDLAAHVTITRHRGVCLWGAPIGEVFPSVPRRHYARSITADFDDAAKKMHANPLYFVLNACRVIAYLGGSQICSKDEGSVWALAVVPDELRGLIRTALDAYRGSYVQPPFELDELDRFALYARKEIDALREQEEE